MNLKQRIIARLQQAIRLGEKRTRNAWTADLRCSYPRFCCVVTQAKLQKAILPSRAEGSKGTIFVQQETRRDPDGRHSCEVPMIRVPACAVRAAGLTRESELSFLATKGRILIRRKKR